MADLNQIACIHVKAGQNRAQAIQCVIDAGFDTLVTGFTPGITDDRQRELKN